MDAQTPITPTDVGIIAAVVAFVGGAVWHVAGMIGSVRSDLQRHRVEVAEHYVKKDQLSEMRAEIRAELSETRTTLTTGIDSMRQIVLQVLAKGGGGAG